MKNSEIAKVLYDIADLLELQAVQFKPRAYRRAARSIEELPDDIEQFYAKGGMKGLLGIPGVGKGIAEKLEEILKTGKLGYYEGLKRKFPDHISALIEVPGLGPKKVKVLNEKLKIKSISDLEKAARSHKISKLKGFGAKTEEDILKGIAIVGVGRKRTLLGHAIPVAAEIESQLRNLADKVVVAGSLRRMQETVGDLDVLAVSENPEKVMEFFTSMPGVSRVLAKGKTKSSILLKGNMQVDLRVVPEKSFGAALQYFTGDIQHNVRLREIAIKKGLKLNEYGIFNKKGTYIAGRTEEDVYKTLGMSFIEPELRCNKGEIEAASKNKLPKLVGYNDIRGDLHIHTNKSDGVSKLQDMVLAARNLGYEYVAITDHSVSERIASGLDEEKMLAWIKEIRTIASKIKGIKVLAGSEVSIRRDGSLDFSNSLLKKMDIVLASIHSRFKSTKKEMTERIVAALDNPYVNVFCHPTGRLIHRRDPYDIDLNSVIESAVSNNVCLEINSQPDRLDLKDVYVRQAKDMGAKFVINTDAHSRAGLWFMKLGIGVARRGWLEPDDIVNTMPYKRLSKYLKKLRD